MVDLAFKESELEKKDYLSKLNDLKYLLTTYEECSDVLLSLFSRENLAPPSYIISTFKNADKLNKNYDFLFLGYDVINESQLIEHYKYKDTANILSFFGAYKVYKDESNYTEEDIYISLEGGLQGDAQDIIEIYELNCLMPLCEFQGDYIVVDLDSITFGALIVIVNGYEGNYLAPSLLDHINDLIEGLESDIYAIGSYGIIYPTTWYLRKKMRSGEQINPRFLA